jgi:DNA-binding transcriptional MocR family regulator
MVVAEFLGEGGYDHHLRRMRRKLQDNFHRIARVIYEAFPDGTRVTRPRGGYVLWIECAPDVDTAALSIKAASHNISVIPGSLFSTTEHYTHCMRLNLGVAWDARVEAALRMLGAWVHEQLSGTT